MEKVTIPRMGRRKCSVAEYGFYLSVGTIVSLVLATASIVWKISRVEKEVREDVDAQIDNVQRDIQKVGIDVVKLGTAGIERSETVRHEFGETAAAIRQKIHETETWNRDTFVRKDSFELVVGRIEKSIDKLGDRFDEKLDKLMERVQKN